MSIEAMKKAMAALESCAPADTSSGHVIYPSFDEKLVDQACEALRTAIQQAESEPVAHLWQHAETGRTRIVMPGDVWTANDRWCYVGTLVLGSTHPAPGVPDDVARDAERWRTFLATRPSNTHEGIIAAIDAASPAQKGGE